MRRLIAKLADGKKYTIETLTLKEQSALRKYQQMAQKDVDRMDELINKGEELSDKETNELYELQDKQTTNLLKILAVSLAKNHDNFKIAADVTEKDINDILSGLLDLRDIRRFVQFAMLGSLPVEEEEEITNVEEIDLTVA